MVNMAHANSRELAQNADWEFEYLLLTLSPSGWFFWTQKSLLSDQQMFLFICIGCCT